MWMYSEKRWTLHPATWYGRPFVFRASGACSFCWLSFCVSGMLQSWHFVASPKCRQSLDTRSSRLHFVTMSMFTDVCLWESFPSGWMCGIPCFFFARFRKMSWNSYRHKGHDHVYFYFMTFIVQFSSHCFWMQSYVLLLESTAGKAFATAADPVASDVASLNSTFWWFFLQLQMRDFNWFFNNYNFWGGQVHEGLLSQVRGGHLFCTDVVSDQGWRWDDETFLRLSPASIYMYIYIRISIYFIFISCVFHIFPADFHGFFLKSLRSGSARPWRSTKRVSRRKLRRLRLRKHHESLGPTVDSDVPDKCNRCLWNEDQIPLFQYLINHYQSIVNITRQK